MRFILPVAGTFGNRLPLAAFLLSALGVGATTTAAHAATLPVQNCLDDGGQDELRYLALMAGDGDVIDMSALTCSKITLEGGEINIGADSVTLLGPAEGSLQIDGNEASRVFFHYGTGTLTVAYLTVENGATVGPVAVGGCIYSKANVLLDRSYITNCSATSATSAGGGGVATLGNLTAFFSTVSGNSVKTTGTGSNVEAVGGGLFAGMELYLLSSRISGNTASGSTGRNYGGGAASNGTMKIKYSTITSNTASGGGGTTAYGFGGGLMGIDQTYAKIEYSTIDHNHADAGGGLAFSSDGSPATATIEVSTISSNTATIAGGGVYSAINLDIESSTIAFNNAGSGGGGGVLLNAPSVLLNNAILANNSPSGTNGGADLGGTSTVSGFGNLIKISSLAVPMETLTVDPKLKPLACKGGMVRVHALSADSPAIDVGASPFSYDTRHLGFPRDVGAAPDIGAYEFDPDRIFTDGNDCF